MRRALLGALAGALLGLAPASSVAAPGCPALAYQAAVARAAAAVGATPPDLSTARNAVSTALSVGGAAVLGPVRDDLAASPPALDDAAQRLAAIAGALGYPAGATCNEDGGAALAQLHGVYAGPDFRRLDAGTGTGVLQSVVDAIGSLVSHISSFLGVGGALAVLAVLAVLVAVVVGRRTRAAALRHAAIAPDALPVGDDPGAEWRAAGAAARRGDHREAVRRAFRGTLLEVARQSTGGLDPAWTTRELLDRLDVPAHVVVALAAAASSFDRAWYSGEAVTPADWETARSRCEAVRAALRSRAGSRA